MLDFKCNWIKYIPLVKLLTITVSKRLLVSHRMKHCIGVNVDHLCIGMRSVKGNFWVQKWYKTQKIRLH
jgi:hypothetical protein